jgi:Na+-translocating ferredoxin:NAD+ oxidoreductase RNF subunit RnfB
MLMTAVLAMGALAALLAALLTIAANRLAVEEDERLEVLVDALPGNNCGACGQPGCRGFAEALLAASVQPAQCTVSTAEDKVRIADLLGVAVGEAERLVARLACAGGSNVARIRARYTGTRSCAGAALISGGGKSCTWGCLGYGDCAASCAFDAIEMTTHDLPEVIVDACTACGDCVVACPKDLFTLEPAANRLWVTCRNEEEGDLLLEDCRVACTACGRCAFDAPAVVAMSGNLPVIKGDQTTARAAIERCPTGAIVWIDDDGAQHKGRNAEVIVRQGALRTGST